MQQQHQDLSPKQVGINRMKLAFLLGLPIAIMSAAYFVFFTGVGLPDGTSNKGILINPPIQINALAANGQPAIIPEDNVLWSFIVIGDEHCDKACRERLYLTRQIKTSLHKRSPRVQRIYLNASSKPMSEELAAFMAAEHKNVAVHNISPDSLKALLASQTAAAESKPDRDYYFADPRGFSMLYYTPEHSYKDTMGDVKFLLKHAPDE